MAKQRPRRIKRLTRAAREEGDTHRVIEYEIKGYYSSDVPGFDVSGYVPEHPEEIHFPLEMNIGPRGDNRSDLYQVVIISPEALRKRTREAVISGRHTLIVLQYSWAEIRRYLERIVGDCAGPTHEDVVRKLSRHFGWEYEDHVADTSVE